MHQDVTDAGDGLPVRPCHYALHRGQMEGRRACQRQSRIEARPKLDLVLSPRLWRAHDPRLLSPPAWPLDGIRLPQLTLPTSGIISELELLLFFLSFFFFLF